MGSKGHQNIILIDGESLTLERAEAIAKGADILLSNGVQKKIEASRKYVSEVVQRADPVYGVNTGFGFFANKRIPKSQLKALQVNLLRSHAAGYGSPLSIAETRLAMVLRLNVLIKGYTGVRFELCQALFNLIKAEIYPIIPEYGSVGASGDLASLAHLALPLIGEGLVSYKGETISAAKALQAAKLQPIVLIEKEGLGLINGTQVMLAVGSVALAQACHLLAQADRIAALTYEGANASPEALHPLIHEVRRQPGQIASARNILKELQGSYLFDSATKRTRMQDPYSLRCAPQIHGPSLDAVMYSRSVVDNELNAATDNPLVFTAPHKIMHGGNFHGQALAFAFDIACMAMSEIANVSDRRLEVLLNPHLSELPAFLTPKEGINSGYMAMQYLSASLVNDNKIAANPACTDSIPGNVGIEDHVSMGMTSARKLKRIVSNTRAVLAAELLAAAQAIDLRKITQLGQGTAKTYRTIRNAVHKLTKDRIVADDIAKALSVFENI